MVVDGAMPREKTGNWMRRICGVDDCAGEAADLHGGGHEGADAGVIDSVFEDHDVD